jgi:RHS repeat-associated protein
MQMPGRQSPLIAGDEHRFGYQGSEMDNEVKSGHGNSYTTHFRQLDPRVGRWLSYDPKATAWESPYVSMGNNPIIHNDILGDSIRNRMTTTMGKQALKAYVNTEEGYNFLSKYAVKGQEIGGRVFNVDGEFHKSNNDLVLTDFEESDGLGTTDAGKRPGMGTNEAGPPAGIINGRLKINVNLNSNMIGTNHYDYRKGLDANLYTKDPTAWRKVWNKSLAFKVQTLSHELMVHAYSASLDFLDNNKMDGSFSKDDHTKWWDKIGVDVQFQKNGSFIKINTTAESLFLYQGLKIAKEVHSRYKTGASNSLILDAHTNGLRSGSGFSSGSIYSE